MRIDPAGWPFVLIGVAIAAVGAYVAIPLGLALLILPVALALFFRDPERVVEAVASVVLSPADGRVRIAGPSTARDFPASSWKQVSIFLSPLDVHVNRSPVSGRVVSVKYHPGRFLPAYRDEATDLNEYTEVVVDHDGQPIVFRQIVGLLVRRVVCRVREGDILRAGDRIGVMKFGSRMDVFVPADATLEVRAGDYAIGGGTKLARLSARSAPEALRADTGTPMTAVEA
jgi:phosphatidylserine decarboxylase